MTEFKNGIYNTLRTLVGTSLGRAVVYTLGHILIAATCNWFITGADLLLTSIDAIVEPLINGVWYYFLDRMWASKR